MSEIHNFISEIHKIIVEINVLFQNFPRSCCISDIFANYIWLNEVSKTYVAVHKSYEGVSSKKEILNS